MKRRVLSLVVATYFGGGAVAAEPPASAADILLAYHQNGTVSHHDSYMYEPDRTIIAVPGGKEPALVFTLDSVHRMDLGSSLELMAVDMFVLEAATSAQSLAGIEPGSGFSPVRLVPGVEAKNVLLVFFDYANHSIAGTYAVPDWRPVPQSDIISMERAEDGTNQVIIRNTNFSAGEYTEERTVTWSTASDGDVGRIRVSEPRIVPSGNYQGGPPQ